MKNLVIALCLSALGLYGASFDAGGVSFSMEEISAKRYAGKAVVSENLLMNGDLSEPVNRDATKGWSPSEWIQGENNRNKFGKVLQGVAIRNIIDTPAGRALHLQNGAVIEETMVAETQNFTSSFTQIIKPAEGRFRRYVFTCDYIAKTMGAQNNARWLLIWCRDDSNPRLGRGKQVGRLIQSAFPVVPDWTPFSYEFTIPDDARDLTVAVRLDGCGDFTLRNIAISPAEAQTKPMDVRLTTMGLLDEAFYMANTQPAGLSFKMRNTGKPEDFPMNPTDIELELPATVNVIGLNSLFKGEVFSDDIPGKDDGGNGVAWKRWRIPMSNAYLQIHKNATSDYYGWGMPVILLVANDRVAATYPCRFVLKQNGQEVSNTVSFTLNIMDKIPAAQMPKEFLTGISVVSYDFAFSQKEAQQSLARFIADTGNGMVNCGVSKELNRELRDAGVKYITTECFQICNGFVYGNFSPDKKPDYAIFRKVDGSPFRNFTCPAAIYKKTQFFNDTVIPSIKEAVANKDGLMPNWEPYSTRGEGCFCDVCKEDFRQYAKLSEDEVNAIWPKELIPGGSYRKQAIAFRGWQHAQALLTVNDAVLEFGGTGIGFCPEVGTDQIIRYPKYMEEQGEFTPYAYADKLKWLNVWGPYAWFIANQPYTYSKGENLQFYEMLCECVKDFHGEFPNAKTKFVAMPHGNQLNSIGLTYPEGIAMDQVSAFLSGFDASLVYFFPRGYDHRYWKALAESATLIAQNEAIVMKRNAFDGVSASAVTPYVSPVQHISPRYMPNVLSSEMLQVKGFSDGDLTLAAVGNFWMKGDVVFRLAVKGLDADKRYSVIEKAFSRKFVKSKGISFTGADLEKGILLHAGALRWAFFSIVPETDSEYESVTSDEMSALAEKLNVTNKKASDFEKALDRKLNAENDCGEMTEMSSGNLQCKPVQKGANMMFQFTSGKNSMLLNTKALAFENWSVDGIEYLEPGSGKNVFSSPGRHGCDLSKIYKIEKQEALPDGIAVTGTLTTTPKSYPELPGLKITRTVKVNTDLTEAEVTVKLQNITESAMEDISLRWWTIPLGWSNTNKGYAFLGKSNKEFRRPCEMTLLKCNANNYTEAKIRKLFGISSKTIEMPADGITLVYPGQKKLVMQFSPDNDFAGIAIWDTASLEAPTVEPCYNCIQLPPLDSAEYKIKFTLCGE